MIASHYLACYHNNINLRISTRYFEINIKKKQNIIKFYVDKLENKEYNNNINKL
jgi:hypothetical protein